MSEGTHTLNLAILGSGGGTNAQAIIDYFSGHPLVRVALVASNNSGAYILERARQAGIPAHHMPPAERQSAEALNELMARHDIDIIALAGYMKLIPPAFTEAWPGRMLNVHPSLLPKYGGKGMYGSRVHEAVIGAGEVTSGVTVHEVTGGYDEGAVRRQEQLLIEPEWDAARLQREIQALEHRIYPEEIERLAAEIVQNKA